MSRAAGSLPPHDLLRRTPAGSIRLFASEFGQVDERYRTESGGEIKLADAPLAKRASRRELCGGLPSVFEASYPGDQIVDQGHSAGAQYPVDLRQAAEGVGPVVQRERAHQGVEARVGE